MRTEAQKRANAKYEREKTKQKRIVFYPSELELFDWISQQPNQQGYIKELIRRDMKESKSQ